MEPPRERFERSISEQDERMKALVDNFKTEMMQQVGIGNLLEVNYNLEGKQRYSFWKDLVN